MKRNNEDGGALAGYRKLGVAALLVYAASESKAWGYAIAGVVVYTVANLLEKLIAAHYAKSDAE